MEQITDRDKCFGCTACQQICPTHAIIMAADAEGFLYPKIDTSICVDCEKCKRVCPANDSKLLFSIPLNVYAVKTIDVTVRKQSQSGGAFTLLSDYIINHSGYVFGAGFDEKMNVKHFKVATKCDRDKLRGSKYVQSDLDDVFRLVRTNLREGSLVLFTGTSCQCAGLRKFIGKEEKNLIICDVLCHGVPSPKLWIEYVQYVGTKHKGKIKAVQFRDMEEKWGISREKFIFDTGEVVYANDYLKLFYSNALTRMSCSKCPFAFKNRVTDITMADYWGIEDVLPEMYDDAGVSLVLINTNKGKRFFSAICDSAYYKETQLEDAMRKNPNLREPAGGNKYRKLYSWIFRSLGIVSVLKFHRVITHIWKIKSMVLHRNMQNE